MAVRDGESILGERVPLPMDDVQTLSWDLGSELAERKPERALLERVDSNCSLTVFEATQHTAVARFRSAVGRESYFGLATADLRDALDSLPGSWRIARSEL